MGIMMTALSQIENEIEKIYEKIKTKKISKNELLRSELACQTSVALLQNNLDKSIKLVQNFKSLSIASKQEQQQEFSINELINTLSDSYQSLLNEQSITLNVFGEDDVIILSYQDVVIDVLSQLIDNSITHAFNHGDDAQITLMLSTTNEQLLIDYVDNGRGLCEEAKARIFDLFYTTKRNSHCTGLGMPIVYNQVTQQLQGTIEYKAPQHQGVGFTITLPMLYQKTAYQLI
jgi:signal transduction histidine kinase